MHLPTLPQKFQLAFERAKARAERNPRYFGNEFDSFERLNRILKVIFSYWKEALKAGRAGEWTPQQVREAVDAALPQWCDYYAFREHGSSSGQALQKALWDCIKAVPSYRAQWNRCQAGIAAVTKRQAALREAPAKRPGPAVPDPFETPSQREARRKAKLNPILVERNWTVGRLGTKSGVGKATVYGYFDGSRKTISSDNRKAIADTLEIKLGELPD